MAKIGFISLGCAKNQVDCERMMFRVQEAGHSVEAELVNTDVVVINTCGFIDSAASEAIDNILQTARLKEAGLVGKILVTGCLSQRYQEEILKEMPEVDGILGTGSYTEIVPAIEALLANEQVIRSVGLNIIQKPLDIRILSIVYQCSTADSFFGVITAKPCSEVLRNTLLQRCRTICDRRAKE